MEATAPSGVGWSKAASVRKAGPAVGADDLDISDDVPLFAFDASNTDTLSGGRPKRKLKAIARFESMTFDKKAAHCKIGEGFACPQCAATCSYDAKECTECQLPCYYEAGIGVLVMKEREIDQSRQHLVQKRAPRRKRQKAKASLKIAVGEVGYTFLKKFDDGWYEGRVIKLRPGAEEGKDRRCVYSDGDSEDLSVEQLRALLLLEKNRQKSVDDQLAGCESEVQGDDEGEIVEVPHLAGERMTRSQAPILPKNEPEDILNGHVNCPECYHGTLWRKGCKTAHCQNAKRHRSGGWVYFCFFCKEWCERGTDFVNCECQWRNTSENRKEAYAQRRLPIDLCHLEDDGEEVEVGQVSDSSEGATNPSPDVLSEDLDEEESHQQAPALNQQSPRKKGGDNNKIATGAEAAWDDEEALGALIYKYSRSAQARVDAEENKRRRSSAAPHRCADELQPSTKKRRRKVKKEGSSPLTATAGAEISPRRDETPTKRQINGEKNWAKRYDQLREYKEELGHCNVPRGYAQNPELGVWVHNQRNLHRRGELSEERRQRLDKVGFSWSVKNPFKVDEGKWSERFRQLKSYKEEHGNCNVPAKYDVDGSKLGKWASKQRHDYKNGELSDDRVSRLEGIEFQWGRKIPHTSWDERFEELSAYKARHGNCNVQQRYAKNPPLGRWAQWQRKTHKAGKLSEERRQRLEAIGFRFLTG